MSFYLHVSLGPVQSFVAQARRTRDFWAGSFLLSWLSGIAYCEAVEGDRTKMAFPKVNDTFLDALQKDEVSDDPDILRQGCMPNRFSVPVGSQQEGIARATAAAKAVETAWLKLSEAVKSQYCKNSNERQLDLWDRQVKSFWQVSWVVTEGFDTQAMDRRKSMRSQAYPGQVGLKCMMMDGWQEMSAVAEGRREEIRLNKEREDFWKNHRNSINGEVDLREDEFLCAIAYIKRRFVRVFPGFSVDVGERTYFGWKVSPSAPSTRYLAALHWIEQVIHLSTTAERETLLNDFRAEAEKLVAPAEDHRLYPCLKDAFAKNPKLHHRRWASLDGEVFFDAELRLMEADPTLSSNAIGARKTLATLRNDIGLGEPSPFCAVIRMDGDKLGLALRQAQNNKVISKALDDFTQKVPGIAEKHNVFLVYAGGDDVLAVSSVEDASDFCERVRQAYLDSFKNHANDVESTISAAISFMHSKVPLARGLSDSYQLLDEVAKAKTGRNALAIRVWKPGGLHLEWAQPWPDPYDKTEKNSSPSAVRVMALAREFSAVTLAGQSRLSNRFFYQFESMLELLQNTENSEEPEFNEAAIARLMASELRRSGLISKDKLTMNQAIAILMPWLDQCRHYVDGRVSTTRPFRADGLMLVKFFVQHGSLDQRSGPEPKSQKDVA